MRQAPKVLLAGVVVYVAVAACSAASHSGAGSKSSAADADVSDDVGDVIAKAVDAVVDGVTNPVGEAAAGPQVDAEFCDKVNGQYAYAEHLYPGKTVAELTFLRATITYSGNSQLPGYNTSQTTALIRDGAAAVLCGTTGTAAVQSTVTFVLP